MTSKKLVEKFDSVREAKAAFDSISPETNQRYEKNSKTSVSVKGKKVTILINSSNSSAMDSSIQHYSELLYFVKSIGGKY